MRFQYFSVVNDTLTRCFGVKRRLNHKMYVDLLTEVFHFRSSVLGKFTLGRSALVKKIIPWGETVDRDENLKFDQAVFERI
jgi:hypothetical protein